MRISKVTTKTGDNGKTKLGNGREVSKADLRIKCLGLIDELNSFIGLAKIATVDKEMIKNLTDIQNQLMNLGGEVSLPESDLELLKNDTIKSLERIINELNEGLPPLKEFILPGDDELSARLHIARSVCRRTESKLVEMYELGFAKKIWIQYLNRLSDYLFVIARYHLLKNEINENQWSKAD